MKLSGEQNKQERCIVSVKYDKKKPKQFLVQFETDEEAIVVHEDIFIKYRMVKGQCLSFSEYDEIIEENNKYLAYITAIRYLGLKMRSAKQISEYLKRKEFEYEHIQSAIQRLQEEKIIDDLLFATMFVQSKTKTKGKGRLLIAQELKQLGIRSDWIEEALQQLDAEEEIDAAYRAAEKKLRGLKGEEKVVLIKLQQFLFRRGYSSSIVRKVMKTIEKERKSNINEDIYGELLDN